MEPTLILYATREGQTRRIAERLATSLQTRGVVCTMLNVAELKEPFAVDEYGAVLLAASVHAGNHEPEMIAFVRKHRDQLAGKPTALLSVSLTEATVENASKPEAMRGEAQAAVQGLIDKFVKETGFHPGRVQPVAGALLYSHYGTLIRLVMKWISKRAGGATDTSHDYEYTDWNALDHFAEEFARSLSPPLVTQPNAE